MKTKISKFLGVSLALLMVFSLAFAFMPTKAEAAPCVWTAEVLPGAATLVLAATTDVTDIAVGPDGTTIYVLNDQTNTLVKSTDGGRTFAAVTPPGWTNPIPTSSVAVAPDNPEVAIVSDGNNNEIVWLTTDGGITWASLLTPTAGGNADTVTDLAVSPAIAGSLFGRHYFATIADDAPCNDALGDVMEIGTPGVSAWATVGGGVAGTHDYMAIECTPGYLGDFSLAVIGVVQAGTGVDTVAGTADDVSGGTDFQVINTNTNLVAPTVTFVAAGTIGGQADFDLTPGFSATVCAEVTLPIDYDATSFATQRAYVGVGCQVPVATDDVYRIDGPAFRRLNGVTTLAVESVSFAGTINGGTLFLGERAAANVRYSNDPTTGAPTWINSAKSPTGAVDAGQIGLTIVRVSPNYQTNSNVFAGTTGSESALSLSYNSGFSFNQISLIDTAIDGVSDVMPTPDGTKMYMATSNRTVGAAVFPESLWVSAVPSNAASWDRIRISLIGGAVADWEATNPPTPGAHIIRLNPDWANAPRLYWCGTTLASVGPAATAIQTSPDGGDSYQNRLAPAAIQDLVAEDGSICYFASAAGVGNNVYRSANSTYTWGPPVNAQAGLIRTIAMAPSYPYLPVAGNVLVGGAAAVGISTDGATTFARSDVGIGGAGALQVLADQEYATNNVIYCGDSTGAAPATYVNTTAAGSGWANMATGSAVTVLGLGMENGVFYSLRAAAGADRTVSPYAAPGTIPWDIAAGGPAVPTPASPPSGLRVAGGTLFAVNAGAGVSTYGDILQTAKTTINAPAGGAVIPVDPVNGRAELVKLAWTAMGFGPGLVNNYNVNIYEKDQGVAGATLFTVPGAPPAGFPGPTVANPTVDIAPGLALPNIAYIFQAGKEYGIQVQANAEVGGGTINSPWSDPVFFSIEFGGMVQQPYAGPILQGPQPGAMDVDPGTGFSWAIVSGATEYEFILATDAALTTTIAGTPATVSEPSFGPVSLEYDTDYWYAVKATAPTTSPQSVAYFHTMAKPVEPPPPVEIPPAQVISPAWIWAVVIIGAILVIAVIFLIVSTRRAG